MLTNIYSSWRLCFWLSLKFCYLLVPISLSFTQEKQGLAPWSGAWQALRQETQKGTSLSDSFSSISNVYFRFGRKWSGSFPFPSIWNLQVVEGLEKGIRLSPVLDRSPMETSRSPPPTRAEHLALWALAAPISYGCSLDPWDGQLRAKSKAQQRPHSVAPKRLGPSLTYLSRDSAQPQSTPEAPAQPDTMPEGLAWDLVPSPHTKVLGRSATDTTTVFSDLRLQMCLPWP